MMGSLSSLFASSANTPNPIEQLQSNVNSVKDSNFQSSDISNILSSISSWFPSSGGNEEALSYNNKQQLYDTPDTKRNDDHNTNNMAIDVHSVDIPTVLDTIPDWLPLTVGDSPVTKTTEETNTVDCKTQVFG
jgi:hypothetical protein